MGKWSIKIPHLHMRDRSKAIKNMALAFIILLLAHAIIVLAISIWLEVTHVGGCGFVQDYVMPVHVLVTSACLTVGLGGVSLFTTYFLQRGGYVRPFTAVFCITVCLEATSGIIAVVMTHKLNQDSLLQDMEHSAKTINAHYTVGNNSVVDTDRPTPHKDVKCWTMLQKMYTCCGVHNHSEWFGTRNTSADDYVIVNNKTWTSCHCDTTYDTCTSTDYGNVYSQPCHRVVTRQVAAMLTVCRVVGPCFGFLQSVAYVIFYYLCIKMHKQNVVSVYQVKSNSIHFSIDDGTTHA